MSHLSQAQRYTIAVLKAENYSQNSIALRIGKDRSVVCRELKRNADKRNGEYKAELAQRKYEQGKADKPKRKYFTAAIQANVEAKLGLKYSPEQIHGLSKIENVACVSVERIYEPIWKDKEKGGDLYKHLRNKGRKYRKRGASKDKRGVIVGRVDIELRPKIVEERSRFGDVEFDTIVGKDHQGGLLSINDRMTGLLKIRKITSKDASQVAQKIVQALTDWKPLLHTGTADNGKEFAQHKAIREQLEIDFFFAKPHHPWQRGANENCNRLVRQYFPKGTDFTNISEQEVQRVENSINNRPRKRHGFLSPIQIFNLNVAFNT